MPKAITKILPLWEKWNKLTQQLFTALGERTHNIVGEFAEQLVADVLNAQSERPSNDAYDMRLNDQGGKDGKGTRVQVKARKCAKLSGVQLSDFHDWDFDVLIIVLFNNEGKLTKVLRLSSEDANNIAKERNGKSNNKADVITLKYKDKHGNPGILREPNGVENLTDQFTEKYNILLPTICKQQIKDNSRLKENTKPFITTK